MLSRVADVIRRINEILFRKRAFKIAIISLTTLFVLTAFLLSIPYSGSKTEYAAEYISEKIKSDSVSGEYSWLSVSEKVISKDKKRSVLREAYDEYFFWKYIFRHSDFGYSKIANANKDDVVSYVDYDFGDNYSLVCANRNYNYKIKNSNIYHHEFYDLELMFRGTRKIKQQDSNFFAISKSDAKRILETKGYEKVGDDFTDEQYFSLLENSIVLTINGTTVSWTLDNIYLENTEYYRNLSKTIGRFFLSYISLPQSIKITDVFFFNTYTFQNMYKLKAISSYYDREVVDYNMCSIAFKNINSFDKNVLLNGLFPPVTSGFFYFLIILEVLIALATFFVSIRYMPSDNNFIDLACYLLPCLLPVLFFGILSKVLKNCLLFSFISLAFIIVFYIIYFTLYFFLLFKKGVRFK